MASKQSNQDNFAGSNLAESSRKLFNKKLQQFAAFMPAGKQSIQAIVDNPEAAAKALENQTEIAQTPANKHMFYSAVVAYLKHTDSGKQRSEPLKQRWEKLQKNNWEVRRQAGLNNEPLQNQIEVAETVKWADVIKMRDSLPLDSLERLLLSVYTYIPPVRADYFEVAINPPKSIQDGDNKKNYIVLTSAAETSSLVIRDFKTSHTYKEIRHILPQPLHQAIVTSLRKTPRKYLFVMPTDATRPYDRNGFSKWANKTLQALFKVSITLTSLRHLYISTIDFNKTRGSELEKIGNAMGHSVSMQKGYQWIEPE
jgi:hypothetical protein